MRPIIIGLFGFFLITPPLEAKLLDRVVAIVGNTPILQSEVLDMQELFSKNPNVANFYGLARKKITTDVIVDLLIAESVVRHRLEELNATIQESEIQKQIQSIANQNKLSVNQLKDSLRREGITFDSYRKNIRLQLEKKAVFEREIRSSTSNISDAELRADFNRAARPEWRLALWAINSSSEATKIMREESERYTEKKKTLEQLRKDYGIEDLGWVNADSLNPAFQEPLKQARVGQAIGPIVVGGVSHILFVEGSRQGNEEQFQAMKEELMRRKQGENLDDLYEAWLQRRKKEIRVVINK